MHMQVALSDIGIPKVNVSVSVASDDEPEVDVSDEEFLQFDTSSVPVIITLTKVICFFFFGAEDTWVVDFL
jgi:exosome complex component RRP42